MLIVLSPSKSMDIKKSTYLDSSEELFKEETKRLVNKLSKLSKAKLKSIMKLSDKQTEEVYNMYKSFNEETPGHAIMSYTGFVYKKLATDEYKEEEFQYIEEHVRILDALYGLLKPSSLIRPYRLDFTMNLDKGSLYDRWKLAPYLKDECIINLASNEYAKMLEGLPMIQISFLEYRENTYKNIATYTKQARGILLNYMIKEQITKIEDIKGFQEAGYAYNEDLSSKEELVFTR